MAELQVAAEGAARLWTMTMTLTQFQKEIMRRMI
jgi:hypothetical protein